MKALSVHPYYAMLISTGLKTVECRTWKTEYRGDILICSTAKKISGTIPGHALGIVELVDVVPFEKSHLKPAVMGSSDFYYGMYAWILKNPRLIKPIPVKGKLSLWNFTNTDSIELLPWPKNEDEDKELDRLYWQPLIVD